MSALGQIEILSAVGTLMQRIEACGAPGNGDALSSAASLASDLYDALGGCTYQPSREYAIKSVREKAVRAAQDGVMPDGRRVWAHLCHDETYSARELLEVAFAAALATCKQPLQVDPTVKDYLPAPSAGVDLFATAQKVARLSDLAETEDYDELASEIDQEILSAAYELDAFRRATGGAA